MKDKSFFQKRWFEFRIGHGNYTAYFIGFSNFIILMYNFVIKDSLPFDIPIWLFAVVFVLVYIPIGILIGLLHKRKQMPTDSGQGAIHYEFRDKIVPVSKETLQNEMAIVNYSIAQFQLRCLRLILLSSNLTSQDKENIELEIEAWGIKLEKWKTRLKKYGQGYFASDVLKNE